MCGAGLSFCQNIHFYVVLSVFSHPCTKKWRSSSRVDVAVCVCVCARKTSHTALDCYSNNPERLLCSPCAFGQSLLEPCKTDGADTLSPFGIQIFFLTDRAQGQTRAHLASRLLLCPNTCTPHMYCRKYCYIIIYIKYCYNYL